MIYSNPTDKTGIVEDIDYLVGSDDNSYPIAHKTRNVNRKFDEIVFLILSADGRWQWDDSNNTDLPITVFNLSSNQDYAITNASLLNITRVEVKDINGKYHLLTPIDQNDINNQAMTELLSTPGMPKFYDKIGDSIFLYPKPSSEFVTQEEGCKIYFQRNASYFEVTDTTKQPGFSPLFHRLLSYSAALDFAIANTMNSKISIFQNIIQGLEQGLQIHYSDRSRDEKIRLSIRKENYGAIGGISISDKSLW